MKISLLDVIQDGLVDIKAKCIMGKYKQAGEIAERLLQVTYEYEIGNYLDQLKVEKVNSK